jgi:hypothetical protein
MIHVAAELSRTVQGATAHHSSPGSLVPVRFRPIQIAQGDLLLISIEHLPFGVVPLPPTNGVWTLMPPTEDRPQGSHTISADGAVAAYAIENQTLASFLVVRDQTQIEHAPKRGEDHCHAPAVLTPNIWRVVRQREHVPTVLAAMPVLSANPAID